MIKTSSISILKTFSNEEIKSFEEFLNSPFCNKNTKVQFFFDLIKVYHPKYDDPLLTKENLFIAMFGSEKYKESYIRNLFSDLNLLLEKFLQQVHILKSYTYDKLLIEEFMLRNLTELTEKRVRMFEKKINRTRLHDEDYYTNKIFIYDTMSLMKVDKTLVDNYRSEEVKSKIKLFLLTVLTSSFYLIIEEQRANIKHDFVFLKHILSYLKANLDEFKDTPLIVIYYYLWLSFLEKNDEHYYQKARSVFKENFPSLPQSDRKNIYSVMQAFCINKTDSGVPYQKELLDVLLEMLKYKVLSHSEHNVINLNLYRNIVVLCAALHEISIMKKFINDYTDFVDTASRESMKAYSQAHVYFLQGSFEKVLEISNRINFSDFLETTKENIFFKNDIRKLCLLSTYELGYLESVLSNIDAYRHFLKNNRLMREDMRRRTSNFLNLFNDLVKIRMAPDDFKLLKLKNRILASKDFMNKKWLIKKVSEIS